MIVEEVQCRVVWLAIEEANDGDEFGPGEGVAASAGDWATNMDTREGSRVRLSLIGSCLSAFRRLLFLVEV